MAGSQRQSTSPPSPPHDPIRRLSQEGPHGLGETEEQHARHAEVPHKKLFGLDVRSETIIFYCFAFPSWGLEIAAAVTGSFTRTWNYPFIGTIVPFMVFHWAAWWMTAIGMLQRASWVRDEGDLLTRREFLYLAVRLNRLQLPTAVIALATFIQAYVRRESTDDLAYWLLFLLIFIWNTVFSVMNAYNNITWESDRLSYEDGEQPYRITRLAILGIPSNPKELPKEM
ncbi:hypothetical protein B0A50_02608 [Salinomyces thailandicus]|uniref:Uncharacterized protein n=1 Tax=Salinomyces thailandicus TaxID=706561 RepID=A0A4U0U5F8_9PEZI|nr:hypothetical protein B0A50_02608 [Salinomyces thailandica]